MISWNVTRLTRISSRPNTARAPPNGANSEGGGIKENFPVSFFTFYFFYFLLFFSLAVLLFCSNLNALWCCGKTSVYIFT